MNICHFTGKFVTDPELKPVNNTHVTKFTLLINGRSYKKSTGEKVTEKAFQEFEAWDAGAVTISKHFRKGDFIIVHGSLRTKEWTDKDGNKRSKNQVRVENFEWVPTVRTYEKEEKPSDEVVEAPF